MFGIPVTFADVTDKIVEFFNIGAVSPILTLTIAIGLAVLIGFAIQSIVPSRDD